jgi:hypothetical protein
LRLYLNLFNDLWVWPILDADHGTLFLSGPKVKLFFFSIDIEADFSSPNTNLCYHSAKERAPKDEG